MLTHEYMETKIQELKEDMRNLVHQYVVTDDKQRQDLIAHTLELNDTLIRKQHEQEGRKTQ
jgi:hypothetical protein